MELSIRLISMLHRNITQTNIIWTHEPVYRDSPIGNLEGFMVSNMLPLQQGFQCNILTCMSVGIDYNSAFLTSEQGIVSTVVSLPNSTAVGTELTCMPSINSIEPYVFIKASLLENLFKSIERNMHNFTVEPFAFRTKPMKIFYRNICIISQSHIRNISYNFANPILNKVVLFSLKSSKSLLSIFTSLICIRLKFRFAFKNMFPFNPDILSKIILMQNFSVRRQHSHSKAFAINVNSENIRSHMSSDIFFRKVRNNLQVWGKPIRLASPAVFEKAFIPLPIAVLFDRNSNPISWVNSKFDKVEIFGRESLAVAGDIELYSNSFCFAFASPNPSFKIADNLSIKRCILFNRGVYFLMEFRKLIAEISLFKKSIEFRSSLQGKVFENSALFGSNFINFQKDSSFHITNHIYMFARLFKYCARNSSPRFRMESPCEVIR